ncbi:unnamed protein product [Larinioides sclopetarius]|uniref:Ras-related protein Rab-43 n=1 Tax=Larinioides sclopetarius TaxID=280406 RepID=A0AAV1Z8C9_9ARAC
MEDEPFDYLFKIVMIGDCGVGKTCVVQRFKSGTYVERHGNTIGVDFAMRTLTINKKRVKLQIWDTAGQERFRTITQSYYRSAHGVIMAYDITKHASFLHLPQWVDELRNYTQSDVPLVLIGKIFNLFLVLLKYPIIKLKISSLLRKLSCLLLLNKKMCILASDVSFIKVTYMQNFMKLL